MVASFFFLMCADRFGRRNLLLITVGGFAIASAATAFVQTKTEFIVCQTIARLFLTSQYGLAIIIAGEELPARLRGTGITILTAFATVGTIAMATSSPFFLLLQTHRVTRPTTSPWRASPPVTTSSDDDGWRGRGPYLDRRLPLSPVAGAALAFAKRNVSWEIAAGRLAASLLGTIRAQVRFSATFDSAEISAAFPDRGAFWNCVNPRHCAAVAY
jgi:MFS family permease